MPNDDDSQGETVTALTLNQEVPSITFATITREMLKDYARVSGDPNPIHLDDEIAKQNGLPSVIAHGMLIAGFLVSRAEGFLTEKLGSGFKFKRIQTRFKAMTFPGEAIQIGGKIKEASERGCVMQLFASNASGETKVIGTLDVQY